MAQLHSEMVGLLFAACVIVVDRPSGIYLNLRFSRVAISCEDSGKWRVFPKKFYRPHPNLQVVMEAKIRLFFVPR